MAHVVNLAIIAGQLVVGGAERQLYLWLSHMDRGRFNPIVLTLHPGNGDYWEDPIENLNIPLYRVERNGNRFSRLIEIIHLLRPHQPDLIHGWHTFASVYAGIAGKVLKAKSLGGIRSSYSAIDGTWETRLSRFLCDAVVANSKVTAASYQLGQKLKKQPVFTVQNAIATEFEEREFAREYLSKAYGLSKDALWVASIGRVDPLKRFDILVRLASMMKDAPFKAHFLLFGDGPQKKALEELARSLGVEDRVTFAGEFPSASRWMKGFDIFCFPSEDEGLPNAVMEAAAAGLPILAWKYPFNEEILEDRKMALLIEPQNLVAMKNALLQLMASKSLRDTLGQAAQEHIQATFSLQRYIESMTEVYETVLQLPLPQV